MWRGVRVNDLYQDALEEFRDQAVTDFKPCDLGARGRERSGMMCEFDRLLFRPLT